MIKRKIEVDASNLRVRQLVENVSVDEANRTAELTFSKGSKGLRHSYNYGPYYEELEISEQAINLSRLNSGAPLLASHNSYDLDAVIGVVERAWIDGDSAKALVRFAKDEESDKIFQKVRDGILKNVSVGYDPGDYQNVSQPSDEIPTLRAVQWTPFEISVVSIGFDAEAQFRNKENVKRELIVLENEVKVREENNEELNQMTEQEKQQLIADAAKAEQTRCLTIRKLVLEAKMNPEMADEYITRGATVESVKENLELFSKYQKENNAIRVQSTTTSTDDDHGNEEKRREGIVNALLHRMDPVNFKLDDNSKQFAGRSLMRVMEQHIGRKTFENDQEFVKRVMTTSDLPYILANVANKSAQKRYELAPKTFQRWTKPGVLKDFKQAMQVRAGDVGSLKRMNEAGEYEQASMGEEREYAQLEKFGVKHSFSDIMIINDDLGLILEVANEAGVAQARLDNYESYQALLSNPDMADGIALFHASHGNLRSSGAAISETTFDDARKAMRAQKSVDGKDKLNLSPKYLIVGPTQETAAQKFLATIQPTQTSNVNVFQNSVELIVDAEITTNEYYFAADQQLIDTVKVNRLQGQESVVVDSRVNWDNDAIELKIKYALQAKAMDWRGLYKVPSY